MAIRPGSAAPYSAATNYSHTMGAGAGVSSYVPEIFSLKILRKFYSEVIFSEITNTDYEGEIRKGGDKVVIRVAPEVAVNDYEVGGPAGGIVYEVPLEEHVELLIDKAKAWAFRMDAIDEVQSDISSQLISEFSDSAGRKLKQEVERDMLTFMTAMFNVDPANQGTTAGKISASINLGEDVAGNELPLAKETTATTTSVADFLVDCATVLGENDVPEENRFVVLPQVVAGLLRKGDLQRADVTGDATGVIRTSAIGMVAGMKVYVNNNVPLAINATGFMVPFGVPKATTFAAQLTKTESLPIKEHFGTFWRGLFVYGRAVVHPEGLGFAVVGIA